MGKTLVPYPKTIDLPQAVNDTKDKTPIPTQEAIERKWYLINATNQCLGRLASEIAIILRGKNKPIYTPHLDTGDFVIVINAEKVTVTGKKREQKVYRRNSGRPGGFKEESFEKLQKRLPARIIETAVEGMLPKNKLGKKLFTKLKVYAGSEHPHQAQKPQELRLETISARKNPYQIIETNKLKSVNTSITNGNFWLKNAGGAANVATRDKRTIVVNGEKTTMAVIREKEEDGYFKLTLHSGLLNVAGTSAKTVEIKLADKYKYSRENLAHKYLEEALKLYSFPLSYEFQSFETGNVNFTKTWIAKFHQYYQNIPVYGIVTTVEIDKNQDLLLISSTLGDLSKDPYFTKSESPISPKQVENIVENEIGSDENLDLHPQLYWYYNSSEKRWQLTYIVEGICKDVTEDEDDIFEIFDYVIDADGGEVIDAIPRTQ